VLAVFLPGVTDSESDATESSVNVVMWGRARLSAYCKVLALLPLIASTCLGPVCVAAAIDNEEQQKSFLPPHWWESASALRNVSLKDDTPYPQLSLDPVRAKSQLEVIRKQGFAGIQVFGPADGGKSYHGLDTRDHFRIESKYGTVADFAHLVRIAHSLGMAVITFDNLGYSALDAPSFLKACDDVREGRQSPERQWYLWSDSQDAPPPATGGRYFFVRPTWLPGYQPEKTEHWVYSEPAKHYYWTRWPGRDAVGKTIDLPQYNWNSPEWQNEAEKIVRFWMDTGIDGMVIDAVNWYVGYTWDKGHRRITDVINTYGNKYSQPEGGGGFGEDPVAWITDGGWNSVQDYGLSIWWEKSHRILENAVATGDPRAIEESLRNYHDPVVAGGGALNMGFVTINDHPEQLRLATAIVATTGHLITDWSDKEDKMASDPEVQWLFQAKALHPALHQMGIRRRLPTNDDRKYYAFIRCARESNERVLVVTNFSATEQRIHVDLSGMQFKTMVDLRSGEGILGATETELTVPGFGYRLFQVE
jgi:Alpha amylase, catalytic domain/Maltogenic Amylase, C-terminal domain